MPDGANLAGPPPQGGGGGGDDRVEEAVRAVLASMAGDMTASEAALLAELEGLGRTVAAAKAEIAALRVDDVTRGHIPTATDELDAVVEHTASATNEILDACETLERLAPSLPKEAGAAVEAQVTRIYEACSFQDITGQRIGKVVNALKAIEARVSEVTSRYGPAPADGAAAAGGVPAPGAGTPLLAVRQEGGREGARTEGERLANGPQLPGGGSSQADIDALLASFD